MSIHPSLAVSDKDKKQRSVLKRTERLRHMMEKGQWKEEDAVYGLPKIKSIRIKIKKEKAEKAVTTATAEGAAAAPATAAGATTKTATTKATATSPKEKK